MDIQANSLFWDADIEELRKGYVEFDKYFKCIICGKTIEKGQIYQLGSRFYDAQKTTELHIREAHTSMLDYFLKMNSTYTGITDIQGTVLSKIAKGFSDKEIATELGVAQSTIRNHRYKLRQKEKQAKIFLAMMDLVGEETKESINRISEKERICDAHNSATTLDERFNITDKEKEKVLKTYMDEHGALKSYPAKAKKKIIVLEAIVKNFDGGKIYSDRELNRILKRIYEDNATIRRALIEYGFIDRTKDCKKYWVKE